METWIPKRQAPPKAVEKIIMLAGGNDEASSKGKWTPPFMVGLLTAFCTAIILSLLRPPIVVFKSSTDPPERAPRLQAYALLAWSLIAAVVAGGLSYK